MSADDLKPIPMDGDAKKLEEAMRRLADALRGFVPEGVGFTVFLFDMGQPSGFVSYLSTANRKDMVDVIKKWIAAQERLA